MEPYNVAPGPIAIAMQYGGWLLRNVRRCLLRQPFLFCAVSLLLILVASFFYFHYVDNETTVVDRDVKLPGNALIEMSRDAVALPVPDDAVAPRRNGSKYGSLPKARSDTLVKQTGYSLVREGIVGVYAMQGRRPHMEDRFRVMTDLPHEVMLFGIFDGHGGSSAVNYTQKTLFHNIQESLKAVGDAKANISDLLFKEIVRLDKDFLETAYKTKDMSGTTVLVAALHGNDLVVANVGDSRGVICDSRVNVIRLSYDHKPNDVLEKERIVRSGGFVSFNGVPRVVGILAMSRAIGDAMLKSNRLVIPDPDILTFHLQVIKPRFMILATDGVWDVFSNKEAVAYINERLLVEKDYGAKSLVLAAYQRGSEDNMAAMVVMFNDTRWRDAMRGIGVL